MSLLMSSTCIFICDILFLSQYVADKNICHNMSSFSESAALGYLKQSAVEFVKYPYVLLDLCSEIVRIFLSDIRYI